MAPHQHLPSDMPDIAASNIFTTRYMDEESGRCSCFESSLYDGDKSCCGEFANGNKSKKGTFTGNYTARSYWDSFADLHAMPKTDYFPHDNTTLAVKDQQRIRQACERSKPPAVYAPAKAALSSADGAFVAADRAALSFTDRNIGVVLGGLAQLGFEETTIVALWVSRHDIAAIS